MKCKDCGNKCDYEICPECIADRASKEFETQEYSGFTVNFELMPSAWVTLSRIFNPAVYEYFNDDDRLN